MFDTGFIMRLPALLVALSVHEYAHARVADRLGDPTPRYAGRLTLNPLAHVDPVGLLMLWVFRFGWAKPVRVNPAFFADPRRGMLLVGLAGPAANVLTALLTAVLFQVGVLRATSWIGVVANWIFTYNVILATFNVLPIPPLDGSRVLAGLIPRGHLRWLAQLEQYGWLILLGLIWTGVIGRIMFPMANGMARFLNELARLLAGNW